MIVVAALSGALLLGLDWPRLVGASSRLDNQNGPQGDGDQPHHQRDGDADGLKLTTKRQEGSEYGRVG